MLQSAIFRKMGIPPPKTLKLSSFLYPIITSVSVLCWLTPWLICAAGEGVHASRCYVRARRSVGSAWQLCWARSRMNYERKKDAFLSTSELEERKKKKLPNDNKLNTHKNLNYHFFIHIPFSKRKIICCWAWYPLKHRKINQSNKWGTLKLHS